MSGGCNVISVEELKAALQDAPTQLCWAPASMGWRCRLPPPETQAHNRPCSPCLTPHPPTTTTQTQNPPPPPPIINQAQAGDRPFVLRTSPLSDASLGFSLGYFATDLLLLVLYYPSFGGAEMGVHHLAALASVAAAALQVGGGGLPAGALCPACWGVRWGGWRGPGGQQPWQAVGVVHAGTAARSQAACPAVLCESKRTGCSAHLAQVLLRHPSPAVASCGPPQRSATLHQRPPPAGPGPCVHSGAAGHRVHDVSGGSAVCLNAALACPPDLRAGRRALPVRLGLSPAACWSPPFRPFVNVRYLLDKVGRLPAYFPV